MISYSSMGYDQYFSALPCEDCQQLSEPIIDVNSGDVICGHCGLVRSHHIVDTGSEVVIYAEDREKGGKSTRSAGFDTSCFGGDDIVLERPMIAPSSGSSQRISEDHMSMLKRAQQYVDGSKRNVYAQLIEMNECCSKLSLPKDIQATANELMVKVLEEHIVRELETIGKRVTIAACIYLACRQHGAPRILDEVSFYLNIDINTLHRIESLIVKKLHISADLVPIIDAKSIINRMVSRLKGWTTYRYTDQCLSICETISQYSHCEGTPPNWIVSGVIIWIIWLNELTGISVDRLCQVCFVQLSHIKSTIMKLYPIIDLIIPETLERQLTVKYAASSSAACNVSNVTGVGGRGGVSWKRCLASLITPSVLDKLLIPGQEIGIPPSMKTVQVVAPTPSTSTIAASVTTEGGSQPMLPQGSPNDVTRTLSHSTSSSSLTSSQGSSSKGYRGRRIVQLNGKRKESPVPTQDNEDSTDRQVKRISPTPVPTEGETQTITTCVIESHTSTPTVMTCS